jgi:multidrug transporter EmrE-like cation transporter
MAHAEVAVSHKVLFLLLVLGGAALETAGDILFKLWSLRDRAVLLVVGLAMYIAGSVMWAFSIKYEQLSKAVFVFVIVNVLLVAAAGLLFFNERFTVRHYVAIGLGIASIALLELD